MEDELDAISRGEEPWTTPLAKFWKPFIEQVEDVEKNVSREQVAQARELGTDPVSGKPMSVRMGRFGPFVQIGTKDDEEKPKFAGLRPGQKMDSITPEQALELFKLPRTLGTTVAGESVVASIGRFGPYIKYGAKYVSLKDDPYTVTLETALECIRLKEEADANRIIQDFGVDNIQVLNGRYGPYISNKEKNARVPKGREPKSLTLEECRALLEAAPLRGRGRFGRKGGGAAAKVTKTGKAAKADGQDSAATSSAATATGAKTSGGKKKRPGAAGNGAHAAAGNGRAGSESTTALAARRADTDKVKRVAAARRKPPHRQPRPAAAKPKGAAAKAAPKPSAKSAARSASGKKTAGAA
jgi:DNA topoisomerase-1